VNGNDRTEQDRAAEARLKLIVAMLSLIYTIWMLWELIPDHRRRLAMMRLIAMLRSSVQRGARRAGVEAMRAELVTDRENYALPYALARSADWLGSVYDKCRNVS
jgi:hypothetical protein